MDEHNGVFRVATTVWDNERTNGVYALNVSNMSVIGKVEGLAAGEDIRAVRFMGDTAYMVTFFQIDPLFVIDMSNPSAPKVSGELKIPGFSSYLHPAGDGLLIGFGRDVDEETERDIGLKISLFDVSNPRSPREVDTMSLPNSWAEATNNPRAMMVDKGRGAFGFVVSSGSGVSFQVIAVQNGRLSSLASEAISIDPWFHSNGQRLCFSGNTLYFVCDVGIWAFSYVDFGYLGEVLWEK